MCGRSIVGLRSFNLHHDECEDTSLSRILYCAEDFSLLPQYICASDQTRLWHNQLEFIRGNHQPTRNGVVRQWTRTAALWTGLHCISSASSPSSSPSLSAAPASSLRTAAATCEGAREDHCQVATADLARHRNRRDGCLA
jgi:hypothetical protein